MMLNVNTVSKTRIKETPAKNKSHYHDSSKKKILEMVDDNINV